MQTMATVPLFLLSLVLSAKGHEHHEMLDEDEANAPVDLILRMHIAVQMVVWAVLFPTGMVLGMTRSRWHVFFR